MEHESFEVSEARIKFGDSSWEGFPKKMKIYELWNGKEWTEIKIEELRTGNYYIRIREK